MSGPSGRASDADSALAGGLLPRRPGDLAERPEKDHLSSGAVSDTDAYLYMMVRWARDAPGFELPAAVAAYAERMEAPPAVRAALAREGLA